MLLSRPNWFRETYYYYINSLRDEPNHSTMYTNAAIRVPTFYNLHAKAVSILPYKFNIFHPLIEPEDGTATTLTALFYDYRQTQFFFLFLFTYPEPQAKHKSLTFHKITWHVNNFPITCCNRLSCLACSRIR